MLMNSVQAILLPLPCS